MANPLDPPGLTASVLPADAVMVLLTGAATIRRSTVTLDSTGRPVRTWADAGLAACNLYISSGVSSYREAVQAGEVRAVTQWSCALPAGTDVRPQDRLVIEGEDYEVVECDRGRTGGLVLVAELVRDSRV